MPYTSQFAGWRLYMCLLLGYLPLLANATHIVGGHLEMKALPGKPGHFNISLIYFFDELQTWPAAPNALIVIYRRQDNRLMDSLRIDNQTLTNRPPVIFANEACATATKMKISMVRYEGELQLNPDLYTDPSGYYLAYQTCCRNGGVTNIQKPNRAGYVYYLEFPALIKNGKPLANSSPAFGTLDGEYICVNKPFTFNFNAFDSDGDQLRYSITAPLYGFQDPSGNPYIRPAPYPEVQWVVGYGPDNEIPGNPPLSINAKTGELSVTATKLGLFVFAIRVEEFRNGEKIGEVRRDYQFLVVDCPSVIPPEAIISIDNQPISTTQVSLCEGKSAQLQATINAAWHYQWKFNGSNLTGATMPMLTISEPGDYSLETSLKNQCSQSKRSANVTIRNTTSSLKLSLDGKPYLCSATDKITVKAPTGLGYLYTWYLDKQEQPNQTTASFTASLPGRYTAIVKDPVGCILHTDTLTVLVGTPPGITLPAELSTPKGGSVELNPVLTGQPIRSQWQPTTYLTNPTQPKTQATGVDTDIRYTLQVENLEGCRAEATVHVTIRERIWIPDTFTPNGDGLNEVWELKGIDAYPNAELTIFNRWGQVIFHTSEGYRQSFNGTVNGQALPTGAYGYTLRPTPGQSERINGVLMLIR